MVAVPGEESWPGKESFSGYRNGHSRYDSICDAERIGLESSAENPSSGGDTHARSEASITPAGEGPTGAPRTLDEAIDAGYIVRKPAEISEPWAEHNITLIPAAEIAAKGYAEVKRTNAGGHRYAIVTASGVTFTHGYEWLIAEGLATRNPVEPVESDKPWPGDGAYASDEFLAERGVKKIQRVKYGAENRYRVEFTDREPLEDVSAGTMRKLRYIV